MNRVARIGVLVIQVYRGSHQRDGYTTVVWLATPKWFYINPMARTPHMVIQRLTWLAKLKWLYI